MHLAETKYITGLRGSSPALIAGILNKKSNCCCILPSEDLVTTFANDLRLFTDKTILTYPGYEIPPYTPLSPDIRTTAARLSTLYQLQTVEDIYILVVSAEALMRKVIPKQALMPRAELILAGEDIDREDLLTALTNYGYEHVAMVHEVGDFSIRGGIIDIFPPVFSTENGNLVNNPIRLDFFGDTVESIRTFDLTSQRSLGDINEATIIPVTETPVPIQSPIERKKAIEAIHLLESEYNWDKDLAKQLRSNISEGIKFAGIEFFLPIFYQHLGTSCASLFDYITPDATFLVVDSEEVSKSIQLVSERIENNYNESALNHTPALPPDEIFLNNNTIEKILSKKHTVHCACFVEKKQGIINISSTNHQLLKQNINLSRKKQGLLIPLSEQIHNWHKGGEHVVLCCKSAKNCDNISNLLKKRDHQITTCQLPLDIEQIKNNKDKQNLLVCNHPLNHGFSLKDHGVHFLSEPELFGEMRIGNKTKDTGNKTEPVRFAELTSGDIVVHRDHGLGIYRTITTVTVQDLVNDFMLIEYQGGDNLYLPVARINLVSRYEGLSENTPKLDKLGGISWQKKTAKVKEEVWKVAQELLTIYAKRELKSGHRFSPPGELYHELEESFPYEETSGQLKAINDTISDLTSEKIMDRLVCGDVGYGKTEVAVRAAFKVVEDGHQVAILVPTTVLSEQHLKTIKERMHGLPVSIETINRFRSRSKQKEIVKNLATGKIDIIIGTQRLLSKDIDFSKLGLLIIDEEHRFGVTHKEKIKKLCAGVDILTLTATPIPRTLQMSLLGIRDLSVISSAPAFRQPVKTFVARYDDLIIKEAVTREMQRGGQTYIVHNRVKSINDIAQTVQNLVPDAKIAIAHGQMNGNDLEKIMVDFVAKRIDVLVCTTIIESGLDIPSANTIIINRADCMGLAEIYQLRGRVGRSSLPSFAYLLVPSLDHLSKDSKDRLRALLDYNELGGGFKLAMSDLQIRGGGNILGVSQSGHITAIGYDLYLDLLQKTITELKKKADQNGSFEDMEDDFDPETNLQISSYIPESYIPDIGQRYIAYRRIAALSQQGEQEYYELHDEFIDRYGKLPKETLNLFTIMEIKKDLYALKVSKLERSHSSLVFSFLPSTCVQPEKLLSYLGQAPKSRKITQNGRLVITGKIPTEKIFTKIKHILSELKTLCL